MAFGWQESTGINFILWKNMVDFRFPMQPIFTHGGWNWNRRSSIRGFCPFMRFFLSRALCVWRRWLHVISANLDLHQGWANTGLRLTLKDVDGVVYTILPWNTHGPQKITNYSMPSSSVFQFLFPFELHIFCLQFIHGFFQDFPKFRSLDVINHC